jgi:hypothetical protein
MAERPEILLITEAKTVHLEMGSDGKFSANSAAWEENKVIPRGRGSRDPRGRRPLVLVKRPAQGGNDWARHAGEGGGSAARA